MDVATSTNKQMPDSTSGTKGENDTWDEKTMHTKTGGAFLSICFVLG